MDSSTVVDVAVFVDTNFDTHFAVSVSPDITAGKFKRELEILHANYFPEMGNIRVHRLMVKRRSCFYHLPEWLPIKHAFQGLRGTWFISLEVDPGDNYGCELAKCVAEEVHDGVSDSNSKCMKRKDAKWKRKKRKIKRFYSMKFVLQELFRTVNLPRKNKRMKMSAGRIDRKENVHVEEQNHPCSLVAAPSQTFSEPLSVSGIIEKYFSGYDEVTSRSVGQFRLRTANRCSNMPVDRIPKISEKTPPAMVLSPSPANGTFGPSRDKLRRGKVGKSLVLASNNLGLCASMRKPTVSLCRRFSKKNTSTDLLLNSSTLVRNLVFDF